MLVPFIPCPGYSLVDAPLTERELAAMRGSVNRGTPLGEERWVGRVAATLGLGHTLRPRGPPRNKPTK